MRKKKEERVTFSVRCHERVCVCLRSYTDLGVTGSGTIADTLHDIHVPEFLHPSPSGSPMVFVLMSVSACVLFCVVCFIIQCRSHVSARFVSICVFMSPHFRPSSASQSAISFPGTLMWERTCCRLTSRSHIGLPAQWPGSNFCARTERPKLCFCYCLRTET